MEGFTCTRLLSYLVGKMDDRQYARRGHSTTDALIYLLQAVHEALDAGDSGARIFFADFSKGFDLIDHKILISELEKLDIPFTLLSWISAFLTDRTQAVRIDGVLSEWKHLRRAYQFGSHCKVKSRLAPSLSPWVLIGYIQFIMRSVLNLKRRTRETCKTRHQ